MLDHLASFTDHQGGRLRLGPDGKLYYTIGNQGANQYSRTCYADRAQRLPTQQEVDNKDFAAYEGKTLRFNVDGSIPEDNPVINGVRSHVIPMDTAIHKVLYSWVINYSKKNKDRVRMMR
ncbi:Quinoprotein glucose dehydrogenase B precursor [Rodentibacter pneumotropicus]|uniref:Quinoprotein glucose dehydrogenase B n=1 Tax=Rodentibacter pneumotropicus TaxID=758 RepID=A0A3S5ERZ6_9PAST|nr:Quinoprotein glucose dehydrogenase B precursor [Rodentibacter pneumotropicus]